MFDNTIQHVWVYCREHYFKLLLRFLLTYMKKSSVIKKKNWSIDEAIRTTQYKALGDVKSKYKRSSFIR